MEEAETEIEPQRCYESSMEEIVLNILTVFRHLVSTVDTRCC